MKTNWLWKESPVMWVPMWQYVINYFIIAPAAMFGGCLILVGICLAFAGNVKLLLLGVAIIIVCAIIGFILEGIVLSRKEKKEE